MPELRGQGLTRWARAVSVLYLREIGGGEIMSVKLMSMTFDADIPDTKVGENNVSSSTIKFVLLAMADHANDDGRSIYPAVGKLCKKTALADRTVQRAIDALESLGIVRATGTSEFGTTEYRIDPAKLSIYGGDSTSKKVTQNHPNHSSNVFEFYKNNIELLTPYNSQILGDMIDTYSEEWTLEALKECISANKKSLKYCEGILKRWKADGFKVDTRKKEADEPLPLAYRDPEPDPDEGKRMNFKEWQEKQRRESQ